MPVPEQVRPVRVSAGVHLTRGVRLTALAVWEALVVCWLALCVTLLPVGIGILLVPSAMDLVRADARNQRRLALRWSGVRVSEYYAPLAPAGQGGGLRAAWRRTHQMIGEGATWRDILWHLVNPLIGPLLAFAPALVILHGAWGVTMLWLWEPVVSEWGNSWFWFIRLDDMNAVVWAAVLGVLEGLAGILIAGPMVRVHGRWVRTVLSADSRDGLEHRVEHLARTRSDAVAHEARELRRIERDLHDGAQARLVAMGMTLMAAERVMDENPRAARAMLLEAKETSAAALQELRQLVRGIHPPVLADRGLVDAIRTRAMESPLQVEVRADIAERPLPPLESAVYFAVSELLANIGKHADATRVDIEITHDDGLLRVAVRDDGHGGADPAQGTGLQGIERRLAAFDGYLLVHSPEGGPTTVTVVVAL